MQWMVYHHDEGEWVLVDKEKEWLTTYPRKYAVLAICWHCEVVKRRNLLALSSTGRNELDQVFARKIQIICCMSTLHKQWLRLSCPVIEEEFIYGLTSRPEAAETLAVM